MLLLLLYYPFITSMFVQHHAKCSHIYHNFSLGPITSLSLWKAYGTCVMPDLKVGEYPPSRMVSHYGTWSILIQCGCRVLYRYWFECGCGCGDDDFSGCPAERLALANSLRPCNSHHYCRDTTVVAIMIGEERFLGA